MLAEQLVVRQRAAGRSVRLETLQDYDAEQLTVRGPSTAPSPAQPLSSAILAPQAEQGVCVFLVSTYEHGLPPEPARWFHTSLLDVAKCVWEALAPAADPNLSFIPYPTLSPLLTATFG